MTKTRTRSKANRVKLESSRGGDGPAPSGLYIPYYEGDTGDRPLPAGVVSWSCPSILVNGAPFNWVPITAGTPINLSVIVGNAGGIGMTTQLTLWWSDPTSAFLQLNPVGAPQVFWMPTGGAVPSTYTSQTITWTPDATVPRHVCILAQVSGPFDGASNSFDPNTDRHYAQQNLLLAEVTAQQTTFTYFFASNPTNQRGRFKITIDRPSPKFTGRHFNADFVRSKTNVSMAVDTRVQNAAGELVVELEPRQRARILLRIKCVVPPAEGQVDVFEIGQQLVDDKGRGRGRPQASLGLVIVPATAE